MKFCQLIEYNMTNIFLKKSCTKCGGETIPRTFSENPKLSIYLDQQPNFFLGLFSLHAKLRAVKIH